MSQIMQLAEPVSQPPHKNSICKTPEQEAKRRENIRIACARTRAMAQEGFMDKERYRCKDPQNVQWDFVHDNIEVGPYA